MNFVFPVGGGQDYNSGQYNVTFSVGVPSVSFAIPFIDDQILEQDELFTVEISLLPVNVIVGDIPQATVTIVNDDSKYPMYIMHQVCLSPSTVVLY